ncbi:MAG: response regulator [Oligoflexia bacterium]|nr:response regulator [Oligoflexia bacterium]
MGKKILIVDDAPVVRLVLRNILESNGYEVVGEASNGREGFDQFKQLRPDLVTMDIVMPDVNGIEALKSILDFDKSAKVVMVTAIDQRNYLLEAINAGAFDYIVKPFEDSRIISTLKKAFGE